MSKFKKGDRIRRITKSAWPNRYGELNQIYKVLGITKNSNPVVIGDPKVKGNGADPNAFELIEPANGFQIGDRVEFLDKKTFGHGVYVVTNLWSRGIRIDKPNTTNYYSHRFKLVERKELDTVRKPSHYNQEGIECIDAIKAALGKQGFIDYCHGNVMKYMWRYKYKNGVEDLQKANEYKQRMDKTIEELEDV